MYDEPLTPVEAAKEIIEAFVVNDRTKAIRAYRSVMYFSLAEAAAAIDATWAINQAIPGRLLDKLTEAHQAAKAPKYSRVILTSGPVIELPRLMTRKEIEERLK